MSPPNDAVATESWASRHQRAIDAHAALVHACEPTATVTRTSEAIQFDVVRDACAVTLIVTAEALELRLPTVEWPSSHEPVSSTRLWKRVLWTRVGADESLRALLDAAFEKRRREFVPCRYCKRPTPPEHRHGRVCHGCAESHLGITH